MASSDFHDASESAPRPPVLYIGTAGWSYPDWVGIVYPTAKPRGWQPIDFISCYFNTCEINTSFYHIPSPRTALSWVRRVAGHPQFLFTAKLWKGFTHAQVEGMALNPPRTDDVQAYRAFLEPIFKEGRLGCILAQFPHSFRPTPQNRNLLERLCEAFSGFPMAVEVRCEAWHTPELLDRFRLLNLCFVNIDQPLFAGSLSPTEEVTTDFFYVRFHGRNRANWFAEDQTAEERYDYLYSREELAPWIERIQRMSQQASRGFVVANNHRRGQAMVNALQLSVDLKRPVPDPPTSLVRVYPSLIETIHPTGRKPPWSSHLPPEQLELF